MRRILHNVNGDNSEISSNSVQNGHNSVQEELNQRFSLPRNPRDAGNVNPSPAQGVAETFNPNQNYGYSNYRSRQPSRQRNSPYAFSRQRTSAGRPGNSRRDSRERPEAPAVKEVILLPRPTATKVPKFHYKLTLQQCGLISDGCAFNRAWNESEVRRFLSSLFIEKLKDRRGEPVR